MSSEDGSQTPPTGHSIPTPAPTTPATSPLAQDHTPYSKTESSSSRHSASAKTAEYVYPRLGLEACRYLIGPMPVQNFLATHLPLPPNAPKIPPCPYQEFLNIPPNAPKEEFIYTPLINALNSLPSKFIFVDTHEASESGSAPGSMKPDITLYMKNLQQLDAQSNATSAKFATMELCIEVKRTASEDCFRDNSDEFIAFDYHNPMDSLSQSHKEKARTLGQHARYAAEIFAKQYRHSVFTLMMFGTKIRFARWDRSGAIVSEAFDCRTNPEPLCQFMWRLQHASLETRGYDTTVEAHHNEGDLVAFQKALEQRLRFELGPGPRTSETQEQFEGRIRVEVNKLIDVQQVSAISMKKGGRQVQYLVSKPINLPISVTGRSTRGYWAFQLQDKELCFLKDTWRKDVGAEQEGSICQELHQAGVPNVPEIDCYSDVYQRSSKGAQRTRTHDFISAPWVKRNLPKESLQSAIVPHIHHRLVLKTVGLDLSKHQDMKELLGFARDMFDTVVAAHKKCGRFHRDISAGNVIIVRDPKTNKRKATIIDWEFSVKENKPKTNSPYTLSGTWQFISSRLLVGDDKAPHRLDDDLESILWVIYWHLLVYYSYPSLSTQGLAAILQKVFDFSAQTDTRMTGGSNKLSYIGGKTLLLEGLTAYPDLRKWLLGYAAYLDNCSAARKWPELLEKIPSPETFRKETLDLVDKHPFSAAPKAPEWKGLRAYRALGTTPGFPATLSASSIEGSIIGQTPSHGTEPAPFEVENVSR